MFDDDKILHASLHFEHEHSGRYCIIVLQCLCRTVLDGSACSLQILFGLFLLLASGSLEDTSAIFTLSFIFLGRKILLSFSWSTPHDVGWRRVVTLMWIIIRFSWDLVNESTVELNDRQGFTISLSQIWCRISCRLYSLARQISCELALR